MIKVGDRVCLSYKKSARGVATELEETSLGLRIHILMDSGEVVKAFSSTVWPEKFKPGRPGYHGPEWNDPASQAP